MRKTLIAAALFAFAGAAFAAPVTVTPLAVDEAWFAPVDPAASPVPDASASASPVRVACQHETAGHGKLTAGQ